MGGVKRKSNGRGEGKCSVSFCFGCDNHWTVVGGNIKSCMNYLINVPTDYMWMYWLYGNRCELHTNEQRWDYIWQI